MFSKILIATDASGASDHLISCLADLAFMFRQSCEDFVRPLPLRRVDQIIRKTFLEKLDDIVLWPADDFEKMPKPQMLSYEQAKRFYDRMGAKQDTQCFYERPALADLLAHLELAGAERLIEFGCGTGRFVEELFVRYLPPNACYVGLDVSITMTKLAQSRTARFGSRAVIRQSSGTTRVDLPDGACDRFISTYVLDLLSEKDIDSLVSEAYRLLTTGGLLGVVSLTKGSRGLSRFGTWTWERLHQFSPMLTDGCRSITIGPRLENLRWKVRHRNVLTPFAIISEIVVAEKI